MFRIRPRTLPAILSSLTALADELNLHSELANSRASEATAESDRLRNEAKAHIGEADRAMRVSERVRQLID
jgi:hydroxymethylglutaryl-CoA reductase